MIDVQLIGLLLDGSAAIAGNTVRVLAGGVAVGGETLRAADIANGYIDVVANIGSLDIVFGEIDR